MKPPSQRQLRVAEQVRHILIETLQRGHFQNDIVLDSAHITIGEVRISPDLKNASVFVSLFGGGDTQTVLKALNDSHGFFQKEIGRQLKIKFTPRLKFVSDSSYDYADNINRLLKDVPKG